MDALRRAGMRRFPLATIVVFAVTAATAGTQAAAPGLLTDLRRSPAGLHGQWWRSLTGLFVQDGGIAGTVSNLLFLLLLGALAEQVLPGWRWLLQYFGTGVACEFVGYAWQPVGGGNSIAVCGLAGAVAVALWRHRPMPGWAGLPLLVWCAALVATQWPDSVTVVLIAMAVAAVALWVATALRVGGRLAAAMVPLVGMVLALLTNLHGAALLVGCLLAVATTRRGHVRAHDQRRRASSRTVQGSTASRTRCEPLHGSRP